MGVKEEEEQPGEELQTLMGGGEPGTKNGVAPEGEPKEESSPTHFCFVTPETIRFSLVGVFNLGTAYMLREGGMGAARGNITLTKITQLVYGKKVNISVE